MAEFFELFKTPWEFHRLGQKYDVVAVSARDVPQIDTKLLILYGPEEKSSDQGDGFTAASLRRGGYLRYEGNSVPVYGDLLVFEHKTERDACVTSIAGTCGLRRRVAERTVLRLGYDLFQEVRVLLSRGQPVENAHIPTLDLHIRMLRNWVLDAGIALMEIPPVPSGKNFVVCLTHDIDFVGIRKHKFDHTMWGFLYRSTVGTIGRLLRGRISLGYLLRSWKAAVSLPFVYMGWARDFWEPFDWYLSVEANLPATYFLIPFKGRAGERVP
ncbi:MAG: hypothetical protein WCE52_09895, partial [Candidatus Acidiferrum sp.]